MSQKIHTFRDKTDKFCMNITHNVIKTLDKIN